jgi:hypothetical protein
MCSGDAFRLCSSEIPNIPRITACMVRHRSDLSPGCRAVMDREATQGGRTGSRWNSRIRISPASMGERSAIFRDHEDEASERRADRER